MNKLTRPEVVKLTGVQSRTLDRWEVVGNFPKRRYRENGYIYWIKGEVLVWMAKRDKYGIVRGGWLND